MVIKTGDVYRLDYSGKMVEHEMSEESKVYQREKEKVEKLAASIAIKIARIIRTFFILYLLIRSISYYINDDIQFAIYLLLAAILFALLAIIAELRAHA